MRLLSAALVAGVLAIASGASAQIVDVSTITCKDFSAQKKDAMLAIMMWLTGFYTKDDDPTVIDFDKVKAKTDKVADYCAKNPAVGLVPAAEPILASE
ncbi:MAG TPA: HdeA/HdeB family chaperone [Xanthobacteraceae bacterium]|nr:HdeA/HdeB family chaperone [Xanthobacteraceae bacterium]